MTGPSGTTGDRLAAFQENIDCANESGDLVVVIGVDFAQDVVEVAKAARELMKNMAPADANHTWPGENELRSALERLDSGAAE